MAIFGILRSVNSYNGQFCFHIQLLGKLVTLVRCHLDLQPKSLPVEQGLLGTWVRSVIWISLLLRERCSLHSLSKGIATIIHFRLASLPSYITTINQGLFCIVFLFVARVVCYDSVVRDQGKKQKVVCQGPVMAHYSEVLPIYQYQATTVEKGALDKLTTKLGNQMTTDDWLTYVPVDYCGERSHLTN